MFYEKANRLIETKLNSSLDELKELISFPSVSTNKAGLTDCTEYVKKLFQARNFQVNFFDQHGVPIIFAERKGMSDKTLLFYNHYDVQPPDPLEMWHTPPFEAIIRDGKLYGRGANDNKGNITNRLLVIDAILDQLEELPCTIKFLIEGEEETSSVHFEDFVKNHADLLDSDACIWEFGGVDHNDIPMQYLGLRGICYVQLECETAERDVHSGLGGSIFPNAAWRLVWALNSLKDINENILIDGFYDAVIRPTEKDKAYMAALPETSADYKERYGIRSFVRGLENGPELRIAEVFEPTCTICGLNSGYQGPGSKTILPSKASAKIDFRLVPNQRPEKIYKLIESHLIKNGFQDIKLTYLGGEKPARTNPDDKFIQLILENAEPVYGKPMQIVPMTGGSGPNAVVQEVLDIPIAGVGIGYPGGAAHAPNENIRLDLYEKTAKFLVRIIDQFSQSND